MVKYLGEMIKKEANLIYNCRQSFGVLKKDLYKYKGFAWFTQITLINGYKISRNHTELVT